MYNSCMTIFFISPEPEICQILSKSFPQHSCYIFSKIESLSELINNFSKMPDLIVMDYLTFNHDIYNVFEEMRRKNTYIPLIFYNDPCLTTPIRSLHWKYILEYEKPVSSDFKVTDELMDIFKEIEQLVESPELSPYIPLMQKSKSINTTNNNKIFLKELLDYQSEEIFNYLQENLSKQQFFLFKILFKNRETYIALGEILEEYKKNDKQMTENSLEVVISRLKKRMEELNKTGYLILSKNRTYKLHKA